MEEFSKSDIINAVAANDTKWLADVLCSLGYEDKDTWAIFTEDDKEFMSTLFASAAIAAQNGVLKPEIIDLLIERTHSVVNIYNFLLFLVYEESCLFDNLLILIFQVFDSLYHRS